MEKITSYHSYPSVYALGHRVLQNLFSDEVLIEEKIDGSQFSFGRFDGVLKARSKGKEILIDAPEKMFTEALRTAESLDLIDGYTYRGEYLQKPKHNALEYSRTPNKHIIIFDINDGHESYLSYEQKKIEAERIGLEIVPIIYQGKIESAVELEKHLERESILGGTKIEGIVIKNYNQFTPDKKALMGKFVSESYKEVHKKEWGESNPGSKDIITKLILMLKTEARWSKSVQHLKESGELDCSPKDIGKLIVEVKKDIKKECEDEIKEILFKWSIDHVIRGVVAGLPEWYKKQLMNSQFDENNNV